MNSFSVYIGLMLLFAGLSPEVTQVAVFLAFGYAGIISHYIKKWSEKVEREEEFHLKKCIPSIILSFITTSVLIILRKEIENLYVITKFSSFIVGYFGNSWFFGLIERKMSNINPPNNENEIN